MSTRTINVAITGQFVKKDSKNAGVMGEGNVTTLHITMDESWSGYGKRIVWRDANGENPVSIVLVAPADSDAGSLEMNTLIPSEPLKYPGWCSFTLEGYKEQDDVHSVSMSVSDHLFVDESDSYYKPAEPTPSEMQQILEAIAKNEEIVKASATAAKSWAVGGTGSREGEDTDNAKYYAESAADDAESAAEDAGSASQSAETATTKASAAASSASAAESSSTESKSWAVGGTGTRAGEDTDNAKYYAEIAEQIAGGGVLTFNGRGGNVLPQDGDYSNDMITGSIRATVLVSYNGGGN